MDVKELHLNAVICCDDLTEGDWFKVNGRYYIKVRDISDQYNCYNITEECLDYVDSACSVLAIPACNVTISIKLS